jgi:hypothetical protein
LNAGREAGLDAEKIGRAAGATATTTKDGVVRIGWPRSDVKVTVDGMPLKPFAGLDPGSGNGIAQNEGICYSPQTSPDEGRQGGLPWRAQRPRW